MKIFHVTGLLVLPFFCFAQKNDSIIHKITTSFYSTFILAERAPASKFNSAHPWIFQTDIGWIKTGKRAWNYCNCYSQNGLSLSYINFDNPTNLGHAFTVSAFIEPDLINYKRFTLSTRGSFGLAILDKVYDSLTNRDNTFVSAKLSFLLGLGLKFSYHLNDYLKLKVGFNLNHISNGGTRNPNDGINFIGYNFGVEYSIKPQKLVAKSIQKFTEKGFGLMLHVFGNQRTEQANKLWQEESRLVLGLNAGVIKRIGRMNGIGVGAEYVYDGINEVKQQRLKITAQTNVGAVSLQHYLFFGKLLFGQQLGIYITPDPGYSNTFFQRYLLEYEFKKNWYAGFSLKSHADESDYFAFSTGHIFRF